MNAELKSLCIAYFAQARAIPLILATETIKFIADGERNPKEAGKQTARILDVELKKLDELEERILGLLDGETVVEIPTDELVDRLFDKLWEG